jgi:hypothetical protein
MIMVFVGQLMTMRHFVLIVGKANRMKNDSPTGAGRGTLLVYQVQ